MYCNIIVPNKFHYIPSLLLYSSNNFRTCQQNRYMYVQHTHPYSSYYCIGDMIQTLTSTLTPFRIIHFSNQYFAPIYCFLIQFQFSIHKLVSIFSYWKISIIFCLRMCLCLWQCMGMGANGKLTGAQNENAKVKNHFKTFNLLLR